MEVIVLGIYKEGIGINISRTGISAFHIAISDRWYSIDVMIGSLSYIFPEDIKIKKNVMYNTQKINFFVYFYVEKLYFIRYIVFRQ